jgi:hypothetical protein
MPLPEFDQITMGQREPEYLTWTALCVAMGVSSYVELGTGSAHFMKRAGIDKVVAMDINNPEAATLHNPHRETGVSYIQGNSHDVAMLRQVVDFLGCLPDAVFIDADHDGDAPRQDFELWYPVAQKLVGFHDIQIPNIAELWREISLNLPSVKLIGCDRASAVSWQGPNCPQDGILSAGGIGVIFK